MVRSNITLIGYGKAGSAFASVFYKFNEFNLYSIIEKDARKSAIIKKHFPGCKFSPDFSKEIIMNSDIIAICVKDSEIISVYNNLRNLNININNKIIFHISGSVSYEVFATKIKLKSNFGSIHPIQSFKSISEKNGELMLGIYFGIEGGVRFLRFAKQLIRKLKSEYVIIPRGKKILYHGVCMFSSNMLVAYFSIIEQLYFKIDKTGNFLKIFKPIITTVLSNVYSSGTQNSLTGPFDRNDTETIMKHVKEFKKNSTDLQELYRILGKQSIKISKSKARISNRIALNLKKILVSNNENNN